MTTLALIPARGGSKGLPGKNIRPIAGRPLIAWTIEAARKAARVDRVIVSTDDEAIAAAARAAGAEVPFPRPSRLATDDAAALDVALHALDWAAAEGGGEPDTLVFLQATSPLRDANDVDAALALRAKRRAHAVVSVGPARDHPWLVRTIDPEDTLRAFGEDVPPSARRQDFPPAYALNGAIYAITPAVLRSARTFTPPATVAYVMPRERSVDIDDALDFQVAETLMEARHAR